MKKLLAICLTLTVLLGVFSLCASAEELSDYVYVTVVNQGKFELAYEKIKLEDADDDGAITINDALYCAHDAKYEGGAEAGYGSYTGDYGMSLSKLWGDESGAFGYTVNNASAMSLADALKDGDHIVAYVYKDQTTWSDKYSYFDKTGLSAKEGDEISLTLSYSAYDENWNPVTLPLADATVTVDGEATEYKTDAEGKVTVKLDKAGEVLISATSEALTLVPPVCVANVEAKKTENTDASTDDSTDKDDTQKPSDTTDDAADDKADGCKSVVSGLGISVIALASLVGATTLRRKDEE